MRINSSSHGRLLAALALSSALLACGDDDEQTFVPPGNEGGSAGTGAGTAGTAGTGGSSGAGQGGAAGKGGAGAGGAAGKGGASGAAGKGGAGGAGASGASGQAGAGAAGAAGTAGTAGAGGDAGTAGAGGDAGTAGTGAAGEAGAGGAGAAGEAGQGGAGQGGTGGAGGAPALTCLPASALGGVLTLEASSPFCAVRVHRTSVSSFGYSFQVNWGQHGGPLSTNTDPDGDFGTSDLPEVRRWALPADPQAALDAAAIKVTVPGVPDGAFYGPAFDVPALALTAISYTGSNATYSGELVAFDTALATVKARAAVNGFYAGVTLPSLPDGKERVVFTALSPVTTAASATSDSGFYALDICDGASLIKTGCGTSLKLGGWGGASGPVAVDAAGTTFAALSTFNANQEVRGFTAAEARGTQAVAGKAVLVNTDYSTSLAASAPTADAQGLAVLQTSDPATGGARPALVYSYASGSSGVTSAKIDQGGFTAVKAGASPVVFGAPDGTIWVAVDAADGGYFVALRRK